MMSNTTKAVFLSFVMLACVVHISHGAASTIQFRAASFEANETDGMAHITVTCTPPPTAPVTALLMRTGSTAEPQDFRFYQFPRWWDVGLSVGFYGSGESEATVELYVADDGF